MDGLGKLTGPARPEECAHKRLLQDFASIPPSAQLVKKIVGFKR
jgi:hypothetical protein